MTYYREAFIRKNGNILVFYNYFFLFLAAMSSSRSNVVTQFVRSFVFLFVRSSPFFLLLSLVFLGVSSCPKEFQWCFKKVLRVFEVSRMFKKVLLKFRECSKEVSKVFQGSFKEILRVFQESFK